MQVLFRLNEPDPEEAILRYLIDLPGVFHSHSGATLFNHLLGTYGILKSWGCDDDLCVAGLFHAIYGTPAYHDGLLAESRRGELIDVIGARAEEIVHEFSRTNWHDVFARGHNALTTLPRSLLTLAAANIVEQRHRLTHANLEGRSIKESLTPFNLLIPYLIPTAARCLAFELQHGVEEV
jgi:Domain of unknown function (DUF6817)